MKYNAIINKENQITASLKLMEELFSQFESSLYLLNGHLFVRNLRDFRKAFESNYSNVKIGYSFKTNYVPALCNLARQQGTLAEVVSGMEYKLALKTGFKGESIIFNGPLKEKDELIEAFENNSLIHFDSYEEIKILKEYLKNNPDKNVRCALRCNFDIREDHISRFGFDAQKREAAGIYNELFKLKGCNPIGIHCHFSTRHRSLESYRIRTLRPIQLAKKIFKDHKLHYIDIGGGFFGDMPESIKTLFPYDVPSFTEYGTEIGLMMREHFPEEDVTLILEPGTSVVANTMCFICKVASIKTIRSRTIVTLTGGLHNVRPTGTKEDIPFRVIKKSSEKNLVKQAQIGGYTCMETDIISESYSGDISVGDYLLFDNMGAYNIVFKPPFIKEAPPIIMFDKQNDDLKFKLVRKRETLDDIFSSYIF